MSNIVTYEQKLSLRKIGYNFDNKCLCGGAMDCVCKFMPDENKLITVSEALDYIREGKGVICWIQFVNTGDNGKWKGVFTIDRVLFTDTDYFDTYPLASSALLTAVLEYLEKKGGGE